VLLRMKAFLFGTIFVNALFVIQYNCIASECLILLFFEKMKKSILFG